MNYQTISEVYEGNDKIREKLKALLAGLTDEQAAARPAGEKWNVVEIVEHLSIVENGMIRICGKLLREAQSAGAAAADGSVRLSTGFLEKAGGVTGETKFEAPERVRPSGEKSIAESLAALDENRRQLYELKPLFESVECADYKFPHPAFGEISAHDWLALVGGHEARHIGQIKRVLEKIQ